MRQDLPTPIRRELDQQRLEFIRWCGTGFEELISKGIDPTPWLASVVQSLRDFVDEQEVPDRAA